MTPRAAARPAHLLALALEGRRHLGQTRMCALHAGIEEHAARRPPLIVSAGLLGPEVAASDLAGRKCARLDGSVNSGVALRICKVAALM